MRASWIVCGLALLPSACRPEAPPAPPASKVEVVTEETFAKEVLDSDQPVLVDFWATWCGPCQLIAPVVDELSIKHAGKVKFVKLDIDEAPKAVKEWKVSVIPMLILFQDGKEVDRFPRDARGMPAYNVKGHIAAWLEEAVGRKN
jgi:thioredoxin 1